ncbi:MAG: hypothetical protein EBU46_15940, partial [Nitrosomonadaceae bacterium]|nr:hypothetical protein [Nitrosomonadaceae bacterium]
MIEFHNPPPFQLGQTVYVPIFSGPKKGKVESATIRCFNAVIFAKEATEAPKVFAVVEGVTFNSWFDFHREDQNYRLSELYATEAEAQAALKFYPVTASDDDWQKITGMHK